MPIIFEPVASQPSSTFHVALAAVNGLPHNRHITPHARSRSRIIVRRNDKEIARSSATYKRARDCRRGLLRMLDGIAELQIDWR